MEIIKDTKIIKSEEANKMESEKIRIKQIMPVPEGYDILTKFVYATGEEEWQNITEYGGSVVLALCDGGDDRDEAGGDHRAKDQAVRLCDGLQSRGRRSGLYLV